MALHARDRIIHRVCQGAGAALAPLGRNTNGSAKSLSPERHSTQANSKAKTEAKVEVKAASDGYGLLNAVGSQGTDTTPQLNVALWPAEASLQDEGMRKEQQMLLNESKLQQKPLSSGSSLGLHSVQADVALDKSRDNRLDNYLCTSRTRSDTGHPRSDCMGGQHDAECITSGTKASGNTVDMNRLCDGATVMRHQKASYDVTPPPTASGPQSEASTSRITAHDSDVICEQCGQSNRRMARFCRFCGKDTAPIPRNQSRTNGSDQWRADEIVRDPILGAAQPALDGAKLVEVQPVLGSAKAVSPLQSETPACKGPADIEQGSQSCFGALGSLERLLSTHSILLETQSAPMSNRASQSGPMDNRASQLEPIGNSVSHTLTSEAKPNGQSAAEVSWFTTPTSTDRPLHYQRVRPTQNVLSNVCESVASPIDSENEQTSAAMWPGFVAKLCG